MTEQEEIKRLERELAEVKERERRDEAQRVKAKADAETTRDRIRDALYLLKAETASLVNATITTDPTDKPEEEFQVRLILGPEPLGVDHLIFLVKATTGTVHTTYQPNFPYGTAVGRFGGDDVKLADLTGADAIKEFVRERFNEFLKHVRL